MEIIMQLIYRGTPYTAPDNILNQSQETVEGKYHGIKIQIALPQISQEGDQTKGLMRYRGVRLVTC
jgi:putative lipoic acid-binding regulatory protein